MTSGEKLDLFCKAPKGGYCGVTDFVSVENNIQVVEQGVEHFGGQ